MAAATTKNGSTAAKTPELSAKLVEAAIEITNVEKKGRNAQQNYDYVTANDVAGVARNALLPRGVLAEFHCVDAAQEQITSRSGGTGLMVKATCELVVTDSESGESITRTSIGYGSDFPGDKAVYKAVTGARKYAFIHLLQIPIGDDPEQNVIETQAKPATPRAPKLPDEIFVNIIEGLRAVGAKNNDLSLMIGAVGGDAPANFDKNTIAASLRALDPTQGEKLLALINAEADREQAAEAEAPQDKAEEADSTAGAK